ncbi:aminotransferase class V-fold PLP-dependent enzyme [Sphingobium sp. CR2-8]|nr:aminotransferase class V-fold PLP-dependent enzyme [Sphingobium sp. CR2-8]MEC3909172.1 aminotransferase class V-fold PLP-dependent enzyme [Sphingobium sp. CR2-8]
MGAYAILDRGFATDRSAFAPPEGGPDAIYWNRIRSQFDIVNGVTFFNNGTYCPPPRIVLETQKRWQRHLASHPQDSVRTDLLEHVRARTAALVNADADEIALTRSTTEGINLLTQGLDWKEGDEIILDRNDHFTAFQSFLNLTRRHGVKLVFVDLSAEPRSDADIIAKYAAAITPRTRILFLNWVNYRAGFRMPIKALAELGHRHGLIVSVDAAQAFGALPIDVVDSGIDHLAAPSHKWILGGPGRLRLLQQAHHRSGLADRRTRACAGRARGMEGHGTQVRQSRPQESRVRNGLPGSDRILRDDRGGCFPRAAGISVAVVTRRPGGNSMGQGADAAFATAVRRPDIIPRRGHAVRR